MTNLEVVWPGTVPTYVPIWRLADFSGLTANVRQSGLALKNREIYFNGNVVQSKRETVKTGRQCRLEIRKNGKIIKKITFLLTYNANAWRTQRAANYNVDDGTRPA